MTRKEERRQVSIEYHNKPHYEAIKDDFLRGAEWADRTMIDKVCEWLKSYRQDTYDGTGYIAGIVNDKTIGDLRKAMEE